MSWWVFGWGLWGVGLVVLYFAIDPRAKAAGYALMGAGLGFTAAVQWT